jgi:hypothetical protein
MQPAGDWTQVSVGPPRKLFQWRGDRMDLGMAVDVMFQEARKAENVPYGTRLPRE